MSVGSMSGYGDAGQTLPSHARRSTREAQSEVPALVLHRLFRCARLQLCFDAVVEQRRPHTLDPAGYRRLGGPGREIEL